MRIPSPVGCIRKREKTTVLSHRTGIDLGIDLEEGKTVPIKKIYAHSYD